MRKPPGTMALTSPAADKVAGRGETNAIQLVLAMHPKEGA